MANRGFKGDRVQIDRLILESVNGVPVVRVSVQFANEDGTVHAISNHVFQIDAEVTQDEMTQHASELMRAAVRRVESIHFTEPSDSAGSVIRGIAETLRTSREPDEPGTQG